MGEADVPIGVVLAGGAGRRIGGSKATVELHGAPLLAYPVAALRAALPEVVVVAKPDTELPPLPGIAISPAGGCSRCSRATSRRRWRLCGPRSPRRWGLPAG